MIRRFFFFFLNQKYGEKKIIIDCNIIYWIETKPIFIIRSEIYLNIRSILSTKNIILSFDKYSDFSNQNYELQKNT